MRSVTASQANQQLDAPVRKSHCSVWIWGSVVGALAWGAAGFAGWQIGWYLTNLEFAAMYELPQHIVRNVFWRMDHVPHVITTFSFAGRTSAALLFGSIGGFTQWLIVRQRVRQAGWWVLASTSGWLGGVALFWVGRHLLHDAADFLVQWDITNAALESVIWQTGGSSWSLAVGLLFGTIVGAICGLNQWFILRRRIRRACWWIFASTLSWAVGMIISWDSKDAWSWSVGLATGGLLTGLALLWLLRRPPKTNTSTERNQTHD